LTLKIQVVDIGVSLVIASHNAEPQHRPKTEVEFEAGTLDCHELESDVASQQGCYSPVSSVSDMEPSADHGRWLARLFQHLFLPREAAVLALFWRS